MYNTNYDYEGKLGIRLSSPDGSCSLVNLGSDVLHFKILEPEAQISTIQDAHAFATRAIKEFEGDNSFGIIFPATIGGFPGYCIKMASAKRNEVLAIHYTLAQCTFLSTWFYKKDYEVLEEALIRWFGPKTQFS